jgi:hypothetical protein
MYQTDIWRDIMTSVHQALAGRLDRLSEVSLMQRSDALLARLPGVTGAQVATTALLLRRYNTGLHTELWCAQGTRNRAVTIEGKLGELTRAVLVTVGIGEGVSVEAAVAMALVLYKRGVVPLCASSR